MLIPWVTSAYDALNSSFSLVSLFVAAEATSFSVASSFVSAFKIVPWAVRMYSPLDKATIEAVSLSVALPEDIIAVVCSLEI